MKLRTYNKLPDYRKMQVSDSEFFSKEDMKYISS